MFDLEDSPAHVTATPAAAAHLTSLAAMSGGELTVLLTDDSARLLPIGEQVPAGALRLGEVADNVAVAGDPDGQSEWWRSMAVVDVRDPGAPDGGIGFSLVDLTEEQVYAAIAAGPLPRY